jgi:hypothetical protein
MYPELETFKWFMNNEKAPDKQKQGLVPLGGGSGVTELFLSGSTNEKIPTYSHREHVEKDKKTGIVVCCTHENLSLGQNLINRLKRYEINPTLNMWSMQPGSNLDDKINNSMLINDYIVLLISPNDVVNQLTTDDFFEEFFTKLERKGIVVLPTPLEKCTFPESISKRLWIDVSGNSEEIINQAVQYLRFVSKLNYAVLTEQDFNAVVVDLLTNIGFSIERHIEPTVDFGIDFKATFRRAVSNGISQDELWFVEVKFYHRDRADLSSLSKFVKFGVNRPIPSKLMLITNGLLTSAARAWVENFNMNCIGDIRVIEGPELKRLLLAHPELVERYFHGRKSI